MLVYILEELLSVSKKCIVQSQRCLLFQNSGFASLSALEGFRKKIMLVDSLVSWNILFEKGETSRHSFIYLTLCNSSSAKILKRHFNIKILKRQ